MREDVVTVVGGGLMGTGIAYTFAAAGCAVLLIDRNSDALARARAAIASMFRGAVERGLQTAEQADEAAARLATHTRLDAAIAPSRLFIETAAENLAVKQAIFREAEPLLEPESLLGTNTSALSITEIGSVLRTPERLVGFHFFNPVHKMKLVELVRGLQTSPQSLEAAQRWVRRIAKTSVVVNEAPGFITSRMSALMGNEAMWMLAEGVASAEDIDNSLRMAFNHPMGPLELGDLTGWDTRLAVLEYLYSVYGEKFRPCPLIRKMVKAGRHGRKTGVGVYRYDPSGNRIPSSDLKASG
ncbi:MAG: FAD-dependent oxidoreductase [Gammaproteobacteria bacterium]|nr:FAD-dependent oxidoreductase [Gammaproteobacteria bacterium]